MKLKMFLCIGTDTLDWFVQILCQKCVANGAVSPGTDLLHPGPNIQTIIEFVHSFQNVWNTIFLSNECTMWYEHPKWLMVGILRC